MHSNLKKMVYRRCINFCALTILAFYPQLADAQRSFIDYRTAVSKDSALVVEVEHKSKSKVLSTKKQTSENIQPDDRIIYPDNPRIPRIPQPFKPTPITPNPVDPPPTPEEMEISSHSYSNTGVVPATFSILKSKAVGDIPCVTNISDQGAAVVTVPLNIPTTAQEYNPELAIVYNSHGVNGALGYGWSISGLSVISRINKTIYYDGQTSGMAGNNSDAFSLDGQRLIMIKSTSDKIYYQTTLGNIKAIATVSNSTISNFLVLYPNGSRAEFNTNDGDNYYVTKTTNKSGRTITYSYTSYNNMYLVSRISYGMLNECVIEFSYFVKSDKYTPVVYSNGKQIKIDRLLGDITMKYGSTSARHYKLYYMQKGLVNLLSKIDCSYGTESLNPLYFYYGKNNYSKTYTKKESQTLEWYNLHENPSAISVYKGKFDYGNDNDGIIEFPNKIGYYKGHKNGSLFSHSKNWTENKFSGTEDIIISTGLQDNLSFGSHKVKTGNGFVDIFSANLDKFDNEEIIKINDVKGPSLDTLKFTVYTPNLYTGIGRKYVRSYALTSLNGDNIIPKYFHCGDFNGDGKNELLVITSCDFLGSATQTKAWLIDLEDDKILYNGFPFSYKAYMIGDNCSAQEAFNTSDKLYTFDYNGDGKSDIVIVRDDATYFYSFNNFGTYWYCSLQGKDTSLKNSNLSDRRVLCGDFNGDGKPDLLVSPQKGSSSSWNIYASSGSTSFKLHSVSITNYNDDDIEFYTQDMNQDGQTDLIKKYKGTLSTYFISNFKYISLINTSVDEHVHLMPSSVSSGNNWYSLMLIHNNGKVDKMRIENDDKDKRLLTGTVNSFGVINKFDYALLNSEYSTTYSAGYINKENYKLFKGGLFVVSNTKTLYKNKAWHDIDYRYTNAVLHNQGLGFCGFENVSSYDRVTGDYNRRTYNPFNFRTLMKAEDNKGEYTYDYTTNVQYNKLANINLKTKQFKDKTNGVNTLTTYTFDTFGNMLSAIADYGGDIKSTVKRTYVNAFSDTENHLGLISTETEIKERAGEVFTTTIRNEYNDKHFVTTTTTLLNGKQSSRTVYTYDSNNIINSKKLYKFTSQQPTSNVFTFNFYGQILTRTNGLGQKETLTYNDSGLLNSVTNHLGLKEIYTYDIWGNITKVTHTDNVTKEISKAWSNGEAGSVFVVTTSESTEPVKKEYYDQFGNVVRTSTLRFDGKYLSIDKVYDEKGRLSKYSYPFKSTPVDWVTNSYDSYNRLTKVKYASQKSDTYSYSGLTKTITSDGISTTKKYNTIGDIIEVTNPSGTITYAYNGDGQPTEIRLPGNIRTVITYDIYGRKIKVDDPSSGISTYEYDAAGNVIRTVDARNLSISTTFDGYDRVKSRTIEGKGSTNFNYDTSGRLVSEVGSDGTRKDYTYDSLNRLSSTKTTGLDGNWFKKQVSYDSKGSISSTNYSSNKGNIVTENYSYVNGTLTNIILQDKVIYTLSKEDDRGRVTEVLNNGITHTTTYDNEDRIITQKTVAGSKVFQHVEYGFDELTGNLVRRADVKRNLEEAFEYDALNRLTKFGNESVTYDDNGNITYNSLIGNLTYNESKPFTLSTVENSRNLISSQSQTLAYNAQERVTSITQGSLKASFDYDFEGNRLKMTYTGANTSKSYKKYYFDDIYEVKTGGVNQEILYLGGNCYSSNVVYMRSNDGAWNLHYLCRDNLGSIIAVIDGNANLESEQSYDAWGNLRSPETWEIYESENEMPALLLDRGYTGHEHLVAFGLINMNARLYNPLLGRFINPDPLLQFGENSQNYNRFVYCLNNPFSAVDISGKSLTLLAIVGIGAAIGAIGNVVYKACSGQINSVGDFFAAAGVGAVAGALSSLAVVAVGVSAVGIAGGMACGAIGGFVSSVVTGIGNAAFFGDEISFMSIASGVAMGAVLGGIGGGIYAKVKGLDIWTGEVKSGTINPQTSNVPETQARSNQSVDTPKSSSSMADAPTQSTDLNLTEHNIEYMKYNDNPAPSDWVNPSYKEGTLSKDLMLKGCVIDRYAPKDWLEKGTYFASPETPYINRSIPYSHPAYGRWQLKVNLPVESSIVAPVPNFQTPGGGIQFRINAGALPASYGVPSNLGYLNADMLVKFGLVIRIK